MVNVTSISGTQGNVGQANYSTAKAGLDRADEDAGARVGAVEGERERRCVRLRPDASHGAADEAGVFEADEGQAIQLGIPERMRELAATMIPLGRPATPHEAAGPILFLCSPWSNFVHGQVITASGGQTTGMTT